MAIRSPIVKLSAFAATLLVLATSPSAGQDSTELTLAQVAEIYNQMPHYKALAIARDHGERIVWGMGFAQPDQAAAVDRALSDCRVLAAERALREECRILSTKLLPSTTQKWAAKGKKRSDTPTVEHAAAVVAPVVSVAAEADPTSSGSIAYDELWVDGRLFHVGYTDELQVWIAPHLGPQRSLQLMIVNGSNRHLNFEPRFVRPSVAAGHRLAGQRIDIWQPEAFLKKEQAKAGLAAGLMGASAAMANQPQPTAATYSGSYDVRNNYGVQVRGDFQGQIITWPSAADYAAAQQRTQAQISAIASQLDAGIRSLSSNLARAHTLPPHTYYGGVIHIKSFYGKRVDVVVTLDGQKFHFQVNK